VAAIRAAQLGQKVAIIEKEFLGGVCLNFGCIPSKSLLKNADLAQTLTKKAKTFGISFDNLQLDYSAAVKRSRQVSKVETLSSAVNVTVEGPAGEELLSTDQVLLATSFIPNTDSLGLEHTGVIIDRRGFVEVDDRMATNVPGIWAIGDVTGKLMLAHAGMAMGTVCAEAIAGKSPEILNYQNMPKATYCHPQVASFGHTEEQAQNAGYDVVTGKFNFRPTEKLLD